MTVNLGAITLISGQTQFFNAPSAGLRGIIITNESGFTCKATVGTQAPRNIYPGGADFFPVDTSFNGNILISPSTLLSTAVLYPSNSMFFEGVGLNENMDTSSFPVSMTRNATGQFAGVQTNYKTITITDNFVPGTSKYILPPLVGQTTTTVAQTLYGTNSSDSGAGLSNAGDLAPITGGTEVGVQTTPGSSTTGWIEITALGGTSTVNAAIPAQSGLGWVWPYIPNGTTQINAGLWSAIVGLTYGLSITAQLTMRISFYNGSAYTTLGTLNIASIGLSTTRVNASFPATSLALINAGFLYIDLFAKGTTAWNTADKVTVFLSSVFNKGITNDFQITTPGIAVPAIGSIAGATDSITGQIYTGQQSVYVGGIDADIVLANAKTQFYVGITGADPAFVQAATGFGVQWRTATAIGGNAQEYQRFLGQPFKSAAGQQIEVFVFQDTGQEVIQGQIYYYVQ